jgi:hypothetical protein
MENRSTVCLSFFLVRFVAMYHRLWNKILLCVLILVNTMKFMWVTMQLLGIKLKCILTKVVTIFPAEIPQAFE